MSGIARAILPVAKSFGSIPANTTTATFVLPKGAGKLEYHAADPNDPGICTLQDSSANTICSTNTSVGDIPNFTGTAFFETLGGTFQVNVTKAARGVSIFFSEGSV